MDDLEQLHDQAERIRASGILGQSRLLRLFNFLVEYSAAGKAPKEAIIAVDVFEKTTTFDVSQDASVRVYIHNLRRKLDQYFDGPGKNERFRLVIPKGEYRLAVIPRGSPETPGAITPWPSARPVMTMLLGAALGAALVAVLALVTGALPQAKADSWQVVRASPVWKRLLENNKPIVVVVGDYYIFGDTEKSADVKRLIREFSINSKADLEQFLLSDPSLAGRYMDVGLDYLPTSSALALANIMPIIADSAKRRVRIELMSDLDAGTVKSANIIYIGLLSGLGSLQGIAFSGSRFEVGDSYDELIDKKPNHKYFSQASTYVDRPDHAGNEANYHDYGYFSTFAGVSGNQILIIAGMQDEGLRETAEALTDTAKLSEIGKEVATQSNFEGLFEVWGMDRVNLSGKLLIAAPLNAATIWNSR